MAKTTAKKPVQTTVKAKKEAKKEGNFSEGKWNLERLAFLKGFFKQRKLSEKDAANNAGIRRETMYHWFNNDDALISSVNNVIDKNGCKITWSLEKNVNKMGNAFVTINTTDVTIGSGSKNLDFLNDAITRYGIKRKECAEKLGISYTALYYWFKHDDTFISYIFKIAEIYGLEVKIQIDEK